MSVNIKELAKLAGVSIGTVSRALRDDQYIAESTRVRLKELAKKLNYIPNNFGKGLQAKKSRLIGYLISRINDSFYNEILDGIGKVVTENGYGLLVAVTDDNFENQIKQIRMFQEKHVDGIIISNYEHETVKYLRKLDELSMPLVVCDNNSFDNNIPKIIIDDEHAMTLIIKYLLELNHKNIAFCFHRNEHSLVRFQICKNILLEYNDCKLSLCNDEASLTNLLVSVKPPTAVICYSDFMAIEVKHIVEKNGLKIPQQVSITGFDDMYFASWKEFDFTTISQPKREIGEQSAKLLLDRINGKKNIADLYLEPKLIIRGSTRQNITK